MIKVPEDVPSIPTKVSVHFFSALPPMGPPTILGAEIAEKSELEKFQPGATVPINIAGLPKDGGLFLYGVLYMPGGGAETWRTTAGVDYHGAYSWDEKVTFTGEPMNLESVITASMRARTMNRILVLFATTCVCMTWHVAVIRRRLQTQNASRQQQRCGFERCSISGRSNGRLACLLKRMSLLRASQ